MRILVVSDTHGDYDTLRRVVTAQPKAEVVIHLGDGEEQSAQLVTDFPEKMIVRIRGNCDWGSSLPSKQVLTVAGKKIFATHGHLYQVKMGYYNSDEKVADFAYRPGSCRGSNRHFRASSPIF